MLRIEFAQLSSDMSQHALSDKTRIAATSFRCSKTVAASSLLTIKPGDCQKRSACLPSAARTGRRRPWCHVASPFTSARTPVDVDVAPVTRANAVTRFTPFDELPELLRVEEVAAYLAAEKASFIRWWSGKLASIRSVG